MQHLAEMGQRFKFFESCLERFIKKSCWSIIKAGPLEQGGRGGVCPHKDFGQSALFFEEPFKCVFLEKTKSEIVNFQ